MTQHPFHSSHHAGDSLNTLLDALVSGKRAPDTGSASACDTDAFATVHHLVAGEYAADASATPSDNTLDQIWRTAMQMPASVSQPQETASPPVSARQKARLTTAQNPPQTSRFQALLSMGAVAALLLILIGAAWLGLGGNGDSPVDPGPGQYAAVPLETGTPENGSSVWYTPVMPEDCVAERMERETYAGIMRTGPTPAPRSYLPVTPVNRDVGADVAIAGRIREACLIYGDMEQWRTLETSSALYARTRGTPEASPMEANQRDELVKHLQIVPFEEQFAYTQERMPAKLVDMWEGTSEAQIVTSTYLPAYAYQLGDGRVAVAEAAIFWANPLDEHFKVWAEENPDAQSTTYAIFSPVDGTWLYDESITICEGDCDSTATPVASPEASPVAFTPEMIISADVAVILRGEPSLDSEAVIALPPQTSLEVIAADDPGAVTTPDEQWMNVRTEDGTSGWIRQIDLEPYKPVATPGE